MHPKAKAYLVQLLRTALSKCEVDRGSVNTWTDEFDAVKTLASKQVGEWLSASDVNGIVDDRVKKQLGAQPEKLSGPLGKFVKPDGIESASKEIADFVASLPRNYRVMFPLPNIALKRDVMFTDLVSFVRTPTPKKGEGLGGLFGSIQQIPKGDTTYISVVGKGYASWSMRQSAIKDAASRMKRVLEVAIAKNVLLSDWRHGPGTTLAALFGTASANILEAAVVDDTEKSSAPVSVPLPIGMSTWLQKLVIYDGTGVELGLTRPRIDPAKKEEGLLKWLRLPAQLLTDPSAAEQTESLRSALEWSFDAHADDDETAAFIKTCIALEGALGEESESDQITERLADRCAFLLGRVPAERSRTRKLIREVYKLRSKLVHGKRTYLTLPDTELVNDAELHLMLVLQKEIEAVENLHTA